MTLTPSYSMAAETSSDLPARNKEKSAPRDPSTAGASDQALTGLMTNAR